ncbi:hypothetical protein [Proteus mirabilis]|uniref:hypothetical protein n=1 Tax=Proteus mirabilis TaxID=584 RepID=UPI0020B73E4F|nr:hypothetical protein [Proteus mirabilis]
MLWASGNDWDREWIQQVVALLVGHGAFTLYPALSQCDNAAERLTRWLTYQLPRVKQAHPGCPIHQWLNSIGAQVIVKNGKAPSNGQTCIGYLYLRLMATRKAGWFCYRHIFYRYMRLARLKPTHCMQTHRPTPVSFGASRLYLKQENALPCTPNSKTAPFACPVRRSKWVNRAWGYY